MLKFLFPSVIAMLRTNLHHFILGPIILFVFLGKPSMGTQLCYFLLAKLDGMLVFFFFLDYGKYKIINDYFYIITQCNFLLPEKLLKRM